jgi:hypothetical protein
MCCIEEDKNNIALQLQPAHRMESSCCGQWPFRINLSQTQADFTYSNKILTTPTQAHYLHALSRIY